MIIPEGEYGYEIRDQGRLIAVETTQLNAGQLSGIRRPAEATDNRHEVEATLDGDGLIQTIRLRYVRGPFSRTANYEAAGETLQGVVTAMGGRNTLEVKMGRFREVDGGLTIFKSLLIAHVRARGQNRWTARVAVIEPATLVAKAIKQSLYQVETEPGTWLFEPAIGERETIIVDDAGRILSHTTRTGISTVLVQPHI
ncbi:MAG TPA: hypothetical protein VGY99_29875 [Candidatus Binataceae bacterium]|nr:hypothetical protein [Candidatus Binataceae bacterium]